MPQAGAIQAEQPMGFRAWVRRPTAMTAAHRHGDMEFNYLIRGEMVYLLGGRVVQVPVGRLCLFWGAVPHQLIRAEASPQCAWVTIPLTWVLQWQLPEQVMSLLLAGQLVVDRSADAPDGEAIRRWAQDLRQTDGRWREVAALEVEARLRRLALGQGTQAAADGGQRGGTAGLRASGVAGGIGHVGKMAEYLAGRYRQAIRVEDVASQVGLHPNYAMSLFRDHCGMSLVQYLTHYRVSQAQRLLATTQMSVTDIAFESGFGSVSRFFEAFSQVCGQSPRAYRQAVGHRASASV